MLQNILKATLVIVALACLIETTQAAHRHCRRSVCDYLFGGYGEGPFGYGDFVYDGRSTCNYQSHTRARAYSCRDLPPLGACQYPCVPNYTETVLEESETTTK